MKNTCSHGCICCHRILTNIDNCKVKGGYDGLKNELNARKPGLFEECILEKDKLPKELLVENEVYLCHTCERWLKQKLEMPPMCYNNGLQLAPIPDELRDLYELEKTLLSKNIVFIKIHLLPITRWKLHKGKSVNVPIEGATLQDTWNKISTYPRLPHEAGVIIVGLKRKKEYKNTHGKPSIIRPEKLMNGAKKLKEINKWYTDVEIENRFTELDDEQSMNEGDDNDNDDGDDDEDEFQDKKQQGRLGLSLDLFCIIFLTVLKRSSL